MTEEIVTEEKSTEEKCYGMSYVPMQAITFTELEAMQKAAEVGRAVNDLTYQFKELVSNILYSSEVNNKSAAIKKLTDEYTARLDQASTEEKSLDPAFLSGVESESHTKSPIKRENGIDYPAKDYAWVPDPSKPSSWRLRLTETPGKTSLAQLGRAAAALSAGGFRGQKAQIPSSALSVVKRRIRAEYRKLGVPETSIPSSVKKSFTVWKSLEDGKWHWFAIYSNNFRDRDNPPEIISEKSHKTFVALTEQGLAEMPKLWHWHIPSTEWGVAEVVGYENGFAWAAGVVNEGHEKEAEHLSKQDNIRVSHGMPSRYIRRSEKDNTVIDFHITQEISPLPDWAAANEHTGFNTFQGVQTMTDAQKEYLKNAAGLTDDEIADREASLESKQQEVEDQGVERKEVEQPVVENKEMIEALGALTGLLKTIHADVRTLKAEVKELRLSDQERITEKTRMTPVLSMGDMIKQMVIGNDEAEIDGRSSLAKSRPKRVVVKETGVGYLDRLISGDDE